MGKFLACLAGPIAAKRLGVRFRPAPMMYSTKNDKNITLIWMKDAITFGMQAEVKRWYEEPAKIGEYSWPSHGQRLWAEDLVHEVDIHYFKHMDENYENEISLGIEIDQLKSVLLGGVEEYNIIHNTSFALTWGIGALAFKAVTLKKQRPTSVYFTNTSEALQAGMLARRVLYAKAKGVNTLLWYTTMENINFEEDEEGLYDCTGIRNTLFKKPKYPLYYHASGRTDFMQCLNA